MVTRRSRRMPYKPILFNSVELHDKMLEHAYKHQPRWFDDVSYTERENFALKYATKLWHVSPTGNPTSVVVSYPRRDGKVRMFDLDSGDFFWVKLKLLTRTKVSGKNTERNYEWNAVLGDDYRCESEDIQYMIDWETGKARGE